MEIIKLVRSFDRGRFNCGKPELNEWLCTQAGQQERADNTRTFLAIDDDQIVGYYATTTYRLEPDDLATAFGAGQGRYPVLMHPCAPKNPSRGTRAFCRWSLIGSDQMGRRIWRTNAGHLRQPED